MKAIIGRAAGRSGPASFPRKRESSRGATKRRRRKLASQVEAAATRQNASSIVAFWMLAFASMTWGDNRSAARENVRRIRSSD